MNEKNDPRVWWNIDKKIEMAPGGNERGAYLLIIHIKETITILRPKKFQLIEGHYAYAGSARNGIKTRLHWHLKKDKPVRWHVDQLTTRGQITTVLWSEKLSECDLSRMLRKKGHEEPMKGFGSSDCKNRCHSHLFRLNLETGQPFFDSHVRLDLTGNG